MKNVLYDLFFAGNDTTSTTLQWAMLYLVKYPQVQRKMREELDSVTGRARCPRWADKPDTPYIEAAIYELQRCANIVPMSVIHTALEDVTVGEYFIPKGTQVFPNIASVLKDPEVFSEPEEFRPERFLSEDGKRVESPPHWIPFGLGKRRCPGETLAKMELYLFLTGIIHNFTIENKPGDELTCEPKVGMMNKPKPFTVKFVPRT